MTEAIWTLEYRETIAATEVTSKTFEEWGLEQPVRRLVSQGTDTFEFQANYDYDEDLPFDPGGVCVIKKDGAGWFYGYVAAEPVRRGSGSEESLFYTLEGPMYFLKETTFQQYWKFLTDENDPDGGFSAAPVSHLMLMQKIDGTKQTLEQQIQEIVDFAIFCGRPIDGSGVDIKNYPTAQQIEDEETPLPIETPLMESRDLSCAAAIIKCLRWLPDCSMYWDYTLEIPVLHIKRRGFLTATSLNVIPDTGELYEIIGVTLRPRYDILRPAVLFYYEKVNSLDGIQYQTPLRVDLGTIDVYPPDATGFELRALVGTISLDGASAITLSGSIVCGTVAENSTDFWIERQPKFGLDGITNFEVTDGQRQGSLPRYVKTGQPAAWMAVNGVRGNFFEDYITAKASYDVESDGSTHSKVAEETIDTKVLTTDLITGDYSSVQTDAYGEGVPVGMAKTIYDSVSVIQYDGQFTIVEDECTGSIGIENVLNLTGGRAEWETMNAQVQQVIESIDDGRTTIIVGPANQLGESDIMELLRESRNRNVVSGGAQRAGGLSQSNSMVLPSQTTKDSSNSIAQKNTKVSMGDTSTPGIVFQSTGAVHSAVVGPVTIASVDANGKEIKLREIDVSIKVNGVCTDKKMIGLFSAPY